MSLTNLVNWLLMGSGGALLASGAMSYGLWVVPVTEDTRSVGPAIRPLPEPRRDEPTAAFQAAKGVTWALLGAGTTALALWSGA